MSHRTKISAVVAAYAVLNAVLRLVLALLHLSGFKLDYDRVPDAEGKRRLLGAVERARRIMPLTAALRVLGLSAGRYHDWVGREEGCSLDDHRSCPRSKPQTLTYQQVEAIGDMVQSKEYRHMTIRGLALHVDVTIIKLLDGTKAYLDAVIDNYSRRILAWTVAEKLNPMNPFAIPGT